MGFGPVSRKQVWICPECRSRNWTCIDRGLEADQSYSEGHDGIAVNRGQDPPPRCKRHPEAQMELGYAS